MAKIVVRKVTLGIPNMTENNTLVLRALAIGEQVARLRKEHFDDIRGPVEFTDIEVTVRYHDYDTSYAMSFPAYYLWASSDEIGEAENAAAEAELLEALRRSKADEEDRRETRRKEYERLKKEFDV